MIELLSLKQKFIHIMNIANDQIEESNQLANHNLGTDSKIEVITDTKYQKAFVVTTNALSLSQQVDIDIAERAKTYKLAGFSKGKGAPFSLVKRQIGKQIMTEHVDKLIHSLVLRIIKEYDINVSGMPNIEIKEFNPEGNIKIGITFNVMPAVPHIDFTTDQFKVEILQLKVDDADIQQAKDALAKAIISYKEAPEGYKAAIGDAVIIDFHGKLNGEDFDGNQATQIRIDLGDGQFIKDFEDKLVGFKKGEESTIKVHFPADYNEEKLADHVIDFSIKIHEVLIKDDSVDVESELQKRFNVSDITKLHDLIREKLLADFNTMSRLRTKKLLFDQIDNQIDFELPEYMVDLDFQNMWKDISTKITAGTINKTEAEAKPEVEQIAKRRVKLGLILADTAKQNTIIVTADDITNAKNSEKMKRPDSTAMIEEFFSKKDNVDAIQGAILEEKVVDYILSIANRNVITITTEEFNNKYAKEIQELIQ